MPKGYDIMNSLAAMFSKKDSEETPNPSQSPLEDPAFKKRARDNIKKTVAYDESNDYGQKIRKMFGAE